MIMTSQALGASKDDNQRAYNNSSSGIISYFVNNQLKILMEQTKGC